MWAVILCEASFYIQSFVLCFLHDFPFAGAFVVDAAQMENTMNNNTMQFPIIIVVGKLLGIGTYGIQANEKVTVQTVAFAVVESDDIRIIIMLQILAVHFQNLFV